METIYRLQHSELPALTTDVLRQGPYSARSPHLDLITKMAEEHREEHPNMWVDSGWTANHGHFCGCQTLDSLKAWFGRFFGPLLERGYEVVKVKVRYSLKGESGKQVFFTVDDIIEVEPVET